MFEPLSNRTKCCPRRSSGTTRRLRASGCVGEVTRSSSSSIAGTVTRSGDSIGSVSRPQSAVPARIAARQRSVAPAQILISALRVDALELAQQGREDVEADGHPADQADRAAQRLARIADQRDRVLQVLEDAMTELQQRFAGRA